MAMAATLRSTSFSLFLNSSKTLHFNLFKQSLLVPRIISQVDVTRQRSYLQRKRTTTRYKWLGSRTSTWKNVDISDENKYFLKESVVDRFKGGVDNKTSLLKEEPWQRHEWTKRTRRTGVLALKIGILPQWTTEGEKFYCTLLQVVDNHVVRYLTPEEIPPHPRNKRQPWFGERGFVEVGALSCSPHIFTESYYQKFLRAGLAPKRMVTHYAVTPDAALQPGTPLTANHFRVGDYVDVQAKTVGHGFQGVMKRWGMKGGPASHGSTKFHRKMGSTGGGGAKSRVWKGKKMPGHMGMSWSTMRGLKIWRINTKFNVLYVNGPCLPGPNHCYVRIYDTRLKKRIQELEEKDSKPPMPTFYPEDLAQPLPDETFDEELFLMNEETLKYDDVEPS